MDVKIFNVLWIQEQLRTPTLLSKAPQALVATSRESVRIHGQEFP